ncbi:helix-turn-helix domain-containing protein [Streptomonospora wellingtoniae]|uniref:Helix-turn-helix domain-containing protein n=1 Tax=Streptomonospora wellingtoniae TaxID=3075544 RepID=A0ABU2KTZ0_9ACTN|nr:helix-turn-helix domain-containing protein [Streptomonospora sp. DSM 45055]MDT0302765.1 helix-turn-helix domain-containing protein [Streptomonospora sp. DSM 45055]
MAHSAGAGVQPALEFTAGRAHPALVPLVSGYQGYRYDAGHPVWRREPPMGVVTVVLNLGAPFDVGWVARGPGACHRAREATGFVAGVHDTAAFTADAGAQCGIEFALSPLGAYALLGAPARVYAREVVDLAEALGAGAGGLVERVAAAPDWSERFALLDAALLERLDTAALPHPDIARAWSVLAASRGRAGVGELCRATGRSRRLLTAGFGEQVGLPPKTMGRILRFRAALARLRVRGPVSLAGVAAECGYYDQAHFSRECADLAGCPPSQLRAEWADDPAQGAAAG